MTEVATTPRALYTQQRLLFVTLDPVHVGAGGYRLGRVDMTIAREPGTDLPKIPGTSLAGATRSYAAMRYGKPDAAGQHKNYKGDKSSCPIIYTFGTATDTSSSGEAKSGGTTQAGTVSIGDAHILFFPVSSMVGPVWVSTVDRVKEAWGENSVTLPQNVTVTDDKVVTNLDWNKELNLGWLLFQVTSGLTITSPASVVNKVDWNAIAKRIVLVSVKLFSQIVNSNLEVRTSVSINPETGAAESGALFTYEAIPRTTWLWTDVVEDDYRSNGNGTSKFPVTDKQYRAETKAGSEQKSEDKDKDVPLGETWSRPLHVVLSGAKLIEYLGVGGMGTRGFGRMRCVADWDVNKKEVQK
jgi:CRISPR-associated protein Cmr4